MEINEMTASERWVKDLLAEISSADPGMMCPSNPVRENELVVATVEDEYLQKLFSLGMYYSRERDRNTVESQYASDVDKIELRKSAWLAAEKFAILTRMFWAYIREFVEVWDAKNMGIRLGWRIVTFDAERQPGIFDIIFGSGGPQGPSIGQG